jgi:iron complex outermembrane recepter protein
MRSKVMVLATTCMTVIGANAHAENSIDTNSDTPINVKVPEIVVTATRTEASLASIPGTMTIIERAQIQAQTQLSNGDLGAALGKLIPGFSVGNQSMSQYGQNLRGRKASILVDGVPQNPLFDPGKNLSVIDPSMIERIEVIRGSTAIYGDAATGGVINIITKNPTSGALINNTTIGANVSLTHPGDSLGGNINHSISGKRDDLSYLFSAAIQKNGGWFDAEGDRIVPNPHRDGGLSDTKQYNIFGKLGFDIDENQKLSANFNLFRNTQDTNYFGDPTQHNVTTGAKARAVSGFKLDDEVGVRNLAGGLDYNNKDVFGSKLHVQLYHKDYFARSVPFDGFGPVYQDTISSKKTGGRVEINTPIIENKASVLWGADASHEKIQQTVKEKDFNLYTSSGGLVFQNTGLQRCWLCPYTQNNYAVFAQGEYKPSDYWVLRGGVRHEEVRLDIPSYITLTNRPIDGGSPSFSATLYNLGAVYYLSDAMNVYGNFSQGFSLPDVRQRLRTGSGGTSVKQLHMAPEIVDNYELGIRGDWSRVSATLAFFYNVSDLGANPPPSFNASILRAPEKIYGVEATLDWTLSEKVKTGGTLTYSEGKNNPENDGQGYIYLNNQRIRPPKLTAYVEHQTLPNWSNRLQMLVSGHRNRFGDSTDFAQYEVNGYTTLDWFSSIKLAKGTLFVGIENLLNRDYYTPQSQQFLEGDVTHVAARGAVLSTSYSFTW